LLFLPGTYIHDDKQGRGRARDLGQIVILSSRFKQPGAKVKTWVKLSFDFDMGQIVICLGIGQIVILYLLPAFPFLRGNSLATGA